MGKKPAMAKPPIPPKVLAAARARAREARDLFKEKPGREQLLTPAERADGAPFYFALRLFVKQLKDAREAAGLTLAQVAARTGLAEETLCRLESGAGTNPTWKTLGLYAVAVNCGIALSAEPLKKRGKK